MCFIAANSIGTCAGFLDDLGPFYTAPEWPGVGASPVTVIKY
jgi:hypothetical protein